MAKQASYSYEDLLRCAHGEMFGPGNARLPLPPLLMMDRIRRISETGGVHGKGEVVAELDLRPDLWFFACHFETDPVMPGCLGLDALWQMVGFFLGWIGALGRGRALGVGGVKFVGQVGPAARSITYRVDIKRLIRRQVTLAVADGAMDVDGRSIYLAQDLKVGLFTTTDGMG